MPMNNPFKNLVLTPEERETEEAFEKGIVKPVKNLAAEKRRFRQIAKYTLEKSKNINIRLTHGDLLRLKAKAIAEGMPYQTLVGSILHKYVASS